MILLIASVMSGSHPLTAAINEPVRTETGLLSGVPGGDPSITVYKGVPYAAPPIGDLRWKAPQPPIPWEGVRKADQFGSICPQMQRDPSAPISEDSLFLNIWSGAASPAERRPVLVWFYGGRFVGGTGSEPLYDGEGLARKGLVVVTMNYRTGVFQRAIAQSGARFPNDPELRGLATSWRPLKDAERAGVEYAEARGAHSLEELRGSPPHRTPLPFPVGRFRGRGPTAISSDQFEPSAR